MAKWEKGESGNPGGRPSGLGDIREFAREHTGTAIATLVRVMNDKDASRSAQVAAATALLDRGWGRPAQTIHASIDANYHNVMVDAELSASASDLIRKVRAENTRGTGARPSPVLNS